MTIDPNIKLFPAIVMMNVEDPAVVLDGEMEVNSGIGFVCTVESLRVKSTAMVSLFSNIGYLLQVSIVPRCLRTI